MQGPLLACAGADVTVLDLSEGMLEKDREIARRENLPMRILKGNMCDLSLFADGTFDLILNPPSLMYVPDPAIVFGECSRVLRKGGTLIMAAPQSGQLPVRFHRRRNRRLLQSRAPDAF